MSDTVFILGAGASRQAGAPLMFDFLDIATDLHRARRVGDRSEHFVRVFEAIGQLQSAHSKAQLDLNNIESVFNAFELGRLIQKLPGIEIDAIEQVIASLKELIVSTIEATMEFPCPRSHILPPKPYDQFAELVKRIKSERQPEHSVSIITFNYDVGVEVALVREDLYPHYSLSNSDSEKPNAVDLLKLHGSLNWATETKSRKIVPMEMGTYLSRYRPSGFNGTTFLPVGSQIVGYFANNEIEVDPEPVIVPPSWNKTDYHKALTNVWSRAAHHLAEAENIFIIGYSLPETDSFFRLLYALGSVGASPLRRFHVYNPDETGEVDKRFRSLLGHGAASRYEYHRTTFDKACNNLSTVFPTRS